MLGLGCWECWECWEWRLLSAAAELRRHGFKTCVLTNTWVDDTSWRSLTAALQERLRRHFDLVLESCRIGMAKPEPGVFSYALEALQTRPQEVIFLDELEENLEPARELGMATILVRDTESALRDLQELCGIQLLGQEEELPRPIAPDEVAHGYVNIRVRKNGNGDRDPPGMRAGIFWE
ncbi:bifunctional epoxide hydrolase 2-like [Pyrgilauda ruficollis]|uniref:bifunctional epoxide hydrolase 2-like n=1 Tax=Pyrgilauda ruficollis TaxID=221976 RepID=UPI001B8744C0|nr:bifunctional epoxide hydrolase 2-like [Pyrgilauda ruficollis]